MAVSKSNCMNLHFPVGKRGDNTYLPRTLGVVRIEKIMFVKCFIKTQSLSSKEGAQSVIIFVVADGHVLTCFIFVIYLTAIELNYRNEGW